MRKIYTPLRYIYFGRKRRKKQLLELNPSDEVISNILKFAATHKTQKISQNQFVDYYLN